MNYLNWEFEVLGRAVAYQNLSGAASHIGLSQPQLSRIVAKIEAETGLILLNREVKRQAVWTAGAYKVAELYQRAQREFFADLQALSEGAVQTVLRIGTLEGLAEVAMGICEKLFAASKLKMIELHVYDLSDLEEKYLGGRLDLIFTLREPGRKKPKYQKTLGYQTINLHGSENGIEVRSLYEQTSHEGGGRGRPAKKRERPERVFASNSLAIRARWIQDFNGFGNLPSAIHSSKKNTTNELPALLIGGGSLTRDLWGQIVKAV